MSAKCQKREYAIWVRRGYLQPVFMVRVHGTFYLLAIVCSQYILHSYQRGGLMDKTLELSAGRSTIRNPGRGKFSLRTTAVDASVN